MENIQMVLIHDLNKKMQQDILNGMFSDTLPSIRLLAQKYNVGTSTMKLSLKRLKEDGFLTGHQGKCIHVNPLAAGNHFFKKNIVLFIKLHRLQQMLYARVIESLRSTFETNGANIHLINSIQQLKSCDFEVDIIIATETKGEELQFITENFPAEKIIQLNGYGQNYTNVGTDNFLAGYESVKYLHEGKKHKYIGILSMYLDYAVSFNKFRRDGANEYCRQHPDVKLYEVDAENFDSVDAAIENLFSQNQNITAIFATMDTLAFSVYSYAAKKKIAIPSQLALLGFDNLSYCKFTIPPLTTYEEDSNSITEALLKLTKNKLMEDMNIEQLIFPPVLINRESI